MPVGKRSSEDLPPFVTNRFEGWPGLWVHAERHADALAEVERLREAGFTEREKDLVYDALLNTVRWRAGEYQEHEVEAVLSKITPGYELGVHDEQNARAALDKDRDDN